MIELDVEIRKLAREEALRVAAPLQQALDAARREIRSLRSQADQSKSAAQAPSPMLSREEVSKILGVTTRTVDRMVARGQLRPGVLVSRHPRWRREWLPGGEDHGA